MLIAVIGDCLLDISVRPSGPIRAGADAPAAIRLSPGGQGANVAVRLARRGARVRLITGLADDAAGRFLREAVEAEGVELAALPVPASGSVVALLDAEGERTMLSDRVSLAVGGLAELLTDATWVHVSGYALLDTEGARVARELAVRPVQSRLSVGGGSLPPGDDAVSFGELLRVAGPDLLILNRDEAAALGAHTPGCLAVVTSGRSGSAATAPGMPPIHVPAPADDRPVLDTTGAGDAYAAALVDELAHLGGWPPPPAELQHAMAVASRLGADVARVEGAQGHAS